MAEHDVRVAIKRVYEEPEPSDGTRVLVDRLWARGISKEAAGLAAWMKELGPTDELRTWFGHQPDRWDAFADKYRHELETPLRQMLLAELQGVAKGSTVTLVYGARDTKANEAVVLRDYLLQERASPESNWDAVAPASALKLFASAILAAHELDGTLKALVTDGSLRESSEGWQLTAHGLEQARQHARMEA